MLLKNTHFKCSAILFDMDGTLLNSEVPTWRACTAWATKYGLDPAFVMREGQGRRTEDTVRALAPTGAPVEADILELMERERHDMDGIVEIAGAAAFLRSIPSDRWAIVTSADRFLALARLKAAKLPTPETLITAEDVQEGKPSPEGYLLAAKKLGFGAESCLVFEDAPAGLAAGVEAGAQIVAVMSELMMGRMGNFSWIEHFSNLNVAMDNNELHVSIQ